MSLPRINTATSKSASGGLAVLPKKSVAIFPQWMKDRDPSMVGTEQALNSFIHETVTCLEKLSSGVSSKPAEASTATVQEAPASTGVGTQPTGTPQTQPSTSSQPAPSQPSASSCDCSAQLTALQSAIAAINSRLDGIVALVSANSSAISSLSFRVKGVETVESFSETLSWGNIPLAWGNNLLAYKE